MTLSTRTRLIRIGTHAYQWPSSEHYQTFGQYSDRGTTRFDTGPPSERKSVNWNRLLVIAAILFVGIVLHELGHAVMYVLTTGHIPTLSVAFLPDPAIAMNYPVTSSMPKVVTAGGLIFTVPLLLLHPRDEVVLIILAFVLYSALEVLL